MIIVELASKMMLCLKARLGQGEYTKKNMIIFKSQFVNVARRLQGTVCYSVIFILKLVSL